MSQKGTIEGYTRVLWGGVTTLELARAIDNGIDQDLCGLYHLTPGYPISKFDLISLIKKIWNKIDIQIEPSISKIGDKSLKTIRLDFDYSTKSYEDMLLDQLKFMIIHKEFYNHYSY
jgi:dTDP-4-dehydrorhamnose reductase